MGKKKARKSASVPPPKREPLVPPSPEPALETVAESPEPADRRPTLLLAADLESIVAGDVEAALADAAASPPISRIDAALDSDEDDDDNFSLASSSADRREYQRWVE